MLCASADGRLDIVKYLLSLPDVDRHRIVRVSGASASDRVALAMLVLIGVFVCSSVQSSKNAFTLACIGNDCKVDVPKCLYEAGVDASLIDSVRLSHGFVFA